MQHQEHQTYGKAFVRTIRTTAIAALSTGVLVCAAVGVAAQDGATQLPAIFMWTSPDGQGAGASNQDTTYDPLSSISSVDSSGPSTDLALETPIYFTWVNGAWPQVNQGTFDATTGALTGASGGEIPITASDPRFDSTAWVNINGQRDQSADSRAIIETRTYRLVDQLGCTWTGTSTAGMFMPQPKSLREQTGLDVSAPAPVMDIETFIGYGHGPCEGLTMWTNGDYLRDEGGQTIIVRAPVPPTPDVPDAALALAN